MILLCSKLSYGKLERFPFNLEKKTGEPNFWTLIGSVNIQQRACHLTGFWKPFI